MPTTIPHRPGQGHASSTNTNRRRPRGDSGPAPAEVDALGAASRLPIPTTVPVDLTFNFTFPAHDGDGVEQKPERTFNDLIFINLAQPNTQEMKTYINKHFKDHEGKLRYEEGRFRSWKMSVVWQNGRKIILQNDLSWMEACERFEEMVHQKEAVTVAIVVDCVFA
ncbi:hypothetical protein LTR85_008118 [Meristemomyces frigidus]|nr:hypothetical protein LTR85_008118 [Meristemomyces frigidus]